MQIVRIVLFAATALMAALPTMSNPLHDAVRDGDLAKLQQLIEAGEDLNSQDDFVGTPLHWAALKNDIEAARLLIHAGGDVNLPRMGDSEPAHDAGRTALMNAASVNAVELIELFVSNGADINAKRTSGKTALHVAVHSSSVGAVRKLVELGVDPNGVVETEPVAFATPLAEAIYRGQIGKMTPEITEEITVILRAAGASE